MITEIVMMLAIALGGAAFSRMLRISSIWFGFAASLVAAMALRGVTFVLLYPIGLQIYSKWVFAALSFAAFVWVFIRERKQLLPLLWLPLGAAVATIIATRVIGFSRLGHSDSRWILIVVHVMQQGDSLGILDDSNVFKRGLIFPLMLALGDSREFLTSLTPYAYAALVSAGIGIATLVLKGYSRRTLWLASLPVVLALYTSTMWLRATFLLNSHLFMGLLITVALLVTIKAMQAGKLDRGDFWLLVLTSFSFGMVRSEGLLINLVILLPLLSTKLLTRAQILWLLITASVSFSIWIAFYNSYILQATHLPWLALMAVLVAGSALPALKWFDWLRARSFTIAIWLLAAVLAGLTIFFSESMLRGWRAIWANLGVGHGLWGAAPFILVLGILFGIGKSISAEHRLLVKVSALLLLTFLAAKTLDDAAIGEPGLGRVGWGDSLNRMWIHVIVVFAITAILGIASRLQPDVKGEIV
ncbi:MAG: hypothetical protein ACKOWE_05490 [Micrococcales bacterium]